jgi:hypothetical protein
MGKRMVRRRKGRNSRDFAVIGLKYPNRVIDSALILSRHRNVRGGDESWNLIGQRATAR